MNKFPKLRYKGFYEEFNCLTLSKVAEQLNGFAFDSKGYDENGLYNIITISNVKGNRLIDKVNGNSINKIPKNLQKHQILKEQDILVSLTGNVGRVSYNLGENNLLNQRVALLRPIDIDKEFLFQNISMNKFEKKMIDLSQGGAQLNISKSDIDNYLVYVPAMDEQEKISSILLKIDILINEKEKEIKIHEKKQKKIMDMVFSFRDSDFEEVRLGDLYEFKNGISKEKSFFGHGTKIVNYMDVNKNIIIDTDSCSGLVECTKSELERFIIKSNDLLFTRTSETSEEIGLSCAIINVEERCVFSGFILKASPKKEVDSRYYAYYMRSKLARREIIKHSSITTRALTSGSNLGAIKVKFPNISYQKKIADILILNDELAQTYSEEMAQFKLMKKQLMFKMLV